MNYKEAVEEMSKIINEEGVTISPHIRPWIDKSCILITFDSGHYFYEQVVISYDFKGNFVIVEDDYDTNFIQKNKKYIKKILNKVEKQKAALMSVYVQVENEE